MEKGRLCIIRYTSSGGRQETMPLQAFERSYGRIEEAIRSAAIEYCATRQGLAEYEDNGRAFDMADFWQSVPEDICLRHGFRKLKNFDTIEGEYGKDLFELKDLPVTQGIIEDASKELAAGPLDECMDLLEACGYEGDGPACYSEARALALEYLGCTHDASAKEDVLEYWMDHCASCALSSGSGE